MNVLAIISLLNLIATGTLVISSVFKKKTKEGVLFFWFCISICVWSLFYLLWTISDTPFWSEIFSRSLMFSSTYIALFFLLFSYAFTSTNLSTIKRFFFYTLTVFLSSLTLVNDFFYGYKLLSPEGIFWFQATKLYTTYLLVWFTLVSLAVLKLVFYYRHTHGINKPKAGYVILGSVVGFIGGATNYFYWYGIEIRPYANISIVFFVISIHYAIYKYNLFDIKIALSKATKYTVYSIYAYTTFYGLTFLYTKFFGSVTAIEPLVIGVIIAPLFAYFLFKLDYYTDMLNRRLFGELHKHSDVLNEISHFLSRNLIRENILKYIEDMLNNFFGVTNSRVVIGGGGSTLIDWKNEYNYVNQVKQDNGSVISIYLPKRDVNEEYSSMDLDMVQAIGSQLSVALERSDLYEKVSHFAEMLEMEVDKKTAQVQQQKNELSQLLRSKDEILHIINHQLNTPLSIIKSASGMVRDGLWTQDKYFEVTTRESERLGQIIKDFWQAEDTSNFKKSLKKEVVDLTSLVEKIIEEKKLLAKVRVGTVTISEDFEGISFKTFCDSTQITQVISNYLDNAIAYTKQGVVKISLREEGNRIICEIIDQGIGFLEASKSKLFEKFVRTDEAKLARPDGSGLGLYICRRIIEAHDGGVWAKSDGLDKGATFGFSLPMTSV